jgi:hypothetical protein
MAVSLPIPLLAPVTSAVCPLVSIPPSGEKIISPSLSAAQSTAPTQAIGVYRGIVLLLPPHPIPLPKERELAETLPQADGVLKSIIKKLSPCDLRLVAEREAVIFVLRITDHHGPETSMSFGEPQRLFHRRPHVGCGVKVPGPACSKAK